MQVIKTRPVLKKSVPVNEPLLRGNEEKYVRECIRTGWISSEGPFVKQFEQSFSKRVERQHGIAVCNGSAALDVAVHALGIKAGDEVIMPTFTIISCAASIVRVGAKPVLVDSDPVTWNMDVSQIEAKITPKTKAIMVVHIYGLPVDIDSVVALAQKYNLKIIEDAAEAIGQTYKGKQCGSFGDISVFSFYPNKHITTGEGGMVVTDDDELAQRSRSFRNLCFRKDRRFVHDELGFNFRMTNLQAAVGLAQLEYLNATVEKKREMGKFYTRELSCLQKFYLPLQRTEYAENIYWVYGLVLKKNVGKDLLVVTKALQKKGIGTRPFFWCMHEQPVFKKNGLFKGESYPVAGGLARRGFYIPSGVALDIEQMKRVVKALKEVEHECI